MWKPDADMGRGVVNKASPLAVLEGIDEYEIAFIRGIERASGGT